MSAAKELPVSERSAWSADEIRRYLRETRTPLRLAVMVNGSPMICSLWFHFENQTLWCATQEDSLVARAARAEPACGFEIANNDPPYHGVRGQGAVTVHSEGGAEHLERLIDRYLGSAESSLARWLMSRSDREVALEIRPRWLTAWDYGARMSDASAAR